MAPLGVALPFPTGSLALHAGSPAPAAWRSFGGGSPGGAAGGLHGRALQATSWAPPVSLAVLGALFLSALAGRRHKRRRPTAGARSWRGTTAARAQADSGSLVQGKSQDIKQEKVLEGILVDLCKEEEPAYSKVKKLLVRLSKSKGGQGAPNRKIQGDWLVLWAAKEGTVDRILGTGKTLEAWWLVMQEFLFRIGKEQDMKGKKMRYIQACEVIRHVGPFPSYSNKITGSYEIAGTRTIQIKFSSVKDMEDKDIEFASGAKENNVRLDVIYSSDKVLCLQWTDEKEGGAEFFVCERVEDVDDTVNKFLGGDRKRLFFDIV